MKIADSQTAGAAARTSSGGGPLSGQPGRCFLVINPGSRHGRSRETAARFIALLEGAAGRRPSRRFPAIGAGYTRDLDDARRLALRALNDGYDTVVAVGGDGTINRVVSAFVECAAPRPEARLGILYSGTSPDFCRFHGIPIDPEAAVETLIEGQARRIDVCRIVHRNAAGEARADHFASSANIGLGAGIAERANRMRPRLGDSAGTLLATVLTIAGRGPRRVRLVIDGEEFLPPPALNVSVGKNPYLAGGLKLETGVAPDDGRLFVFAICGVGRLHLLAALPRIYSGAITRDPRFLMRRATSVRIEPLEGDLRTEFDGDPAGFCPAEISVLPGAVQLIGGAS